MKRKNKSDSKGDFMTFVVRLAFVQLTIYSIWQMVVFTHTGNEASTLTQWFFTFWGIEVGLMMLKKLMDTKWKSRKSDADSQTPPEEEVSE